MRGLIRFGTGLTVLGAAFVGAVSAWPIAVPERLGMLTGDAARGAYLARSSGCVTCHTDIAAQGAPLAGGAPLDTPFGSFVPPNITIDRDAGIGDWTLDEFAVALRQGVAPDGSAYYPAFPYEFYAEFTDQDIADLWAAIATVPPDGVPAPDHDVGFPFNQRWGLKLWRAAFMAPVRMSPVVGRSDAWNRGQTLVEGAAHCAACHTPRNALGGLSGDGLAGNDTLPGGSVAPGIAPWDLRDAGWTAASLSYALRTGITPSGDVFGGSMSEVVREGTSFLTDADRDAIAAYLTDDADPSIPAQPIAVPDTMDDMPGMTMDDMPGMVMD